MHGYCDKESLSIYHVHDSAYIYTAALITSIVTCKSSARFLDSSTCMDRCFRCMSCAHKVYTSIMGDNYYVFETIINS